MFFIHVSPPDNPFWRKSSRPTHTCVSRLGDQVIVCSDKGFPTVRRQSMLISCELCWLTYLVQFEWNYNRKIGKYEYVNEMGTICLSFNFSLLCSSFCQVRCCQICINRSVDIFVPNFTLNHMIQITVVHLALGNGWEIALLYIMSHVISCPCEFFKNG